MVGLLLVSTIFSFAQEKGWEAEWNEILRAAKREGKVVLRASVDPILRRELPAAFKAKFGITVEYLTGRGGDVAARIKTERQAGVHTVDVFLGGLDTLAMLYREEILDPLRPALILPDVVDPSKWKRGKLWFSDPEEKYILRLSNYVTSILYFNKGYVKPEEIKSAKDLLNPKWKGKISAYDPTVPGPGITQAAQLYFQLGEEFVKRLYIEQQAQISRDSRQLADWLARGAYPISFGISDIHAVRLQEEGFPVVAVYSLLDLPGMLSGGSALAALLNRAPHPNAAKLFLNWIASKEGLEFTSRVRLFVTTRNDVDESFLPPGDIPRPGVNYFDSYSWHYTVNEREKVRLRMKELLNK
jgi:ABC-type Fe3+ transport system substrate-binding protein